MLVDGSIRGGLSCPTRPPGNQPQPERYAGLGYRNQPLQMPMHSIARTPTAVLPVAGPRPHRPYGNIRRNGAGPPQGTPPSGTALRRAKFPGHSPRGGSGPGKSKIPTLPQAVCIPYRWYFHTILPGATHPTKFQFWRKCARAHGGTGGPPHERGPPPHCPPGPGPWVEGTSKKTGRRPDSPRTGTRPRPK